MEHSYPLVFRTGNSFLRSLSIYHKRYLDDTHHTPFPTPSPHFITASQLDMMDRIGSAPSVDWMGKLSVRVLDSLPLPFLIILFLACLALINFPTTNQSILPTYSPPLSEKDSHSQFNTGVFTNTPQYVAVVATGRRSSRFREWRESSLDSVEEVDEKREELC